jgi:hypothetical protein
MCGAERGEQEASDVDVLQHTNNLLSLFLYTLGLLELLGVIVDGLCQPPETFEEPRKVSLRISTGPFRVQDVYTQGSDYLYDLCGPRTVLR